MVDYTKRGWNITRVMIGKTKRKKKLKSYEDNCKKCKVDMSATITTSSASLLVRQSYVERCPHLCKSG